MYVGESVDWNKMGRDEVDRKFCDRTKSVASFHAPSSLCNELVAQVTLSSARTAG